MARTTTLEGLRSDILTSIFGRRLGLDINEFLVGPKDHKVPVTAATSATSGTIIPNYGFTTLLSATGLIPWQLQAPEPGVRKELTATGSAAGVVTLVSGTFQTSASSTQTALTFSSSYANTVSLMGISTSVYEISRALTTGVTIA